MPFLCGTWQVVVFLIQLLSLAKFCTSGSKRSRRRRREALSTKFCGKWTPQQLTPFGQSCSEMRKNCSVGPCRCPHSNFISIFLHFLYRVEVAIDKLLYILPSLFFLYILSFLSFCTHCPYYLLPLVVNHSCWDNDWYQHDFDKFFHHLIKFCSFSYQLQQTTPLLSFKLKWFLKQPWWLVLTSSNAKYFSSLTRTHTLSPSLSLSLSLSLFSMTMSSNEDLMKTRAILVKLHTCHFKFVSVCLLFDLFAMVLAPCKKTFSIPSRKWKRRFYYLLPWPKKRTIVVMHHVISKNLQSDFAAIHRCVKSRQSQVAFACAVPLLKKAPWFLDITRLWFYASTAWFFFFLSRVVKMMFCEFQQAPGRVYFSFGAGGKKSPPTPSAFFKIKLPIVISEANSKFHKCWRVLRCIILIPKTIGNRKKRLCVRLRSGNTTWENLQIEKHKSVRWAERTPPDLCFSIWRFSQVVFITRAQPHAQSLFSISNSFWY